MGRLNKKGKMLKNILDILKENKLDALECITTLNEIQNAFVETIQENIELKKIKENQK